MRMFAASIWVTVSARAAAPGMTASRPCGGARPRARARLARAHRKRRHIARAQTALTRKHGLGEGIAWR